MQATTTAMADRYEVTRETIVNGIRRVDRVATYDLRDDGFRNEIDRPLVEAHIGNRQHVGLGAKYAWADDGSLVITDVDDDWTLIVTARPQ